MKDKIVLFLLVFITLVSAQKCTTYACDSLIVRKLLDVNGRQDIKVDDVVIDNKHGFNLSYKLIDTLLPEMNNFSTSIYRVNLSHNKIRVIPTYLTKLCIGDVDLSNNQISQFPDSIFAWHWDPYGRGCHVVWLDSNLITNIPDSLGFKNVFATLSLQWNRICGPFDSSNSGQFDVKSMIGPQDCSQVSAVNILKKAKNNTTKPKTNSQQVFYDLTGRLIKQTIKCNLNSKSGIVIIKDDVGITRKIITGK